MEQKTKVSEAAQRAAQVKSLRTEASDMVRHSWLVMTGMNVLSVLIPVLIPVAYVVMAVLMKLPLSDETVLCGVVSLLAGMVLQCYFSMGQAGAMIQSAKGKEIRLRDVVSRVDDAGRVLALFVGGFILLCAAVVPGACLIHLGWSIGGAWRVVLMSVGCLLAAVLLVVVALSTSLSLFVLAEDAECSAAVALLRSARMMKGSKRRMLMALVPAVLIMLAMTAAMALLLWPMTVKRDFLTDALMYAGGVAYVIAACWSFMYAQSVLTCVYNTVKE